ncbi:MAG: hypothetical protein FJZ38_21610 [Candidatus Rokubacteria bacterium]|nr:hypothetical protein [Candidatus Rokubacteria bacterium]
MKKRLLAPMAGLALVGPLTSACATMTGAAVGAGMGYGTGKGALIGAGVGAAGGAIYDAMKQ